MPLYVKQRLCGLRDTSKLQFRQATASLRSLPNFVIIGAQKSGTSSLFAYLAQHPQLVASFQKEVHYFDGGLNPEVDTFAMGPSWYKSHFPLRTALAAASQTFEASPLYLFHPLVPERMANLVPSAKLIAVLRNPTERAISHYFHNKRRKREDRSLPMALEQEAALLEPLLQAANYKHPTFIHCSYQLRGNYKEQVDRFLQHYPRDQLLVLNSQSLFEQPEQTLQRVFRFVGVDPTYRIPDLKPENVGTMRRDVDPAIYDQLAAHFEPYNQALYELIGEDFGW